MWSQVGLREHPVLRELAAGNRRLPDAGMRSSAEQAQLLAFLIELMGARGFWRSAASPAMARWPWRWHCRPGHGGDPRRQRALAGDRAAHWGRAGVADRIELRLGLALDGLDRLADEGAAFDLAYVDADKKLYDDYYERALVLVRPGGVVALDNVLWHGEVADPGGHRPSDAGPAGAQREDHGTTRVSPVLLPIGDGADAGTPALSATACGALRSSVTSLRQPADIDRAGDQRLADDEARRAVDAQLLGQCVIGVEPLLDPGGIHLGLERLWIVALGSGDLQHAVAG